MDRRSFLATTLLATGSAISASPGRSSAAQEIESRDGYIRPQQDRWVLGTSLVEKIITLSAGRLTPHFFQEQSLRPGVHPGWGDLNEVRLGADGQEITGGMGGWVLMGGQARQRIYSAVYDSVELAVRNAGYPYPRPPTRIRRDGVGANLSGNFRRRVLKQSLDGAGGRYQRIELLGVCACVPATAPVRSGQIELPGGWSELPVELILPARRRAVPSSDRRGARSYQNQ